MLTAMASGSPPTPPENRRPRKVCYVLINYYEQTYRHYLYLYELLRELSRDHEMALIIEDCHGTPDFPDMEEVHILRHRDGWRNRVEMFRLMRDLRRRGYEVFYSHYSYRAALTAGVVTKLYGGEVYFWNCIMVDHFLDEMYRISGRSPLVALRNAVFRFRMRMVVRMITSLVTGSDFMADYYGEHFGAPPEKTLVLANWIRPERYRDQLSQGHLVREQLSIPADHRIVLYVHGLVRGKGGHRLPRICWEVLQEAPKTDFIIIGDGPTRPYVEHELDRLGIRERVHLLGHVENSIIGRYYAVADVFMLPSMFDAFTRVVLEAMACGVPFVATDGGGGVRAYTSPKQHECIVTVDEVHRFPEMILTLLRDEAYRRELIAEGYRQVASYTHECAVERFRHHVIEGHPEPLDPTSGIRALLDRGLAPGAEGPQHLGGRGVQPGDRDEAAAAHPPRPVS